MSAFVSRRARRIVEQQQVAPFLVAHTERLADAWSPDHPDGYIGVCLAENTLTWDLLEGPLTAARRREPTAVRYDDRLGNRRLRRVLADFVEDRFFHRPVAPEDLLIVAGASSVLELLFHCLCDPGDGVLVPTPSYNGFWADLEIRDEAVIVPVHRRPDDGFRLTTELLDAALAAADRPVRALLWTNPDNPMGTVATAAEVREIVAWTRANGLHLVADEIYAASVFGDATFTSVGALTEDLGDDIHWVWAVSKDLAASGLRCGTLLTGNRDVVDAVHVLNMWAMVSGDTQALVADLLADQAWADAYLAESCARLRAAYRGVAEALTAAGIPFVPSDAGVFLLVDLRGLLDAPTWAAEDRLWRRILEETNVNLTPGARCHVVEPGFFRFVFAAVPPEAAVAAVHRLGALR